MFDIFPKADHLDYIDDLGLVYLDKDFVRSYKDKEPPFGQLGAVVYLRTYSRYLSRYKRREFWYETVARVVDYSMSLDNRERTPVVLAELKAEAKELYDHIFNLKVYPAGRTLWVGGSEETREDGTANFNCSLRTIDSLDAYPEMMYLLMVGAGTGFSVERMYVDQLPKLYSIPVSHKPYKNKAKADRAEFTTATFYHNHVKTGEFTARLENLVDTNCPLIAENAAKADYVEIQVGDSKVGWCAALRIFLHLHTFSHIKQIVFDYSSVRPQGERLRKMGGRASGPEPLKTTFQKIAWTIKYKTVENKLTPTSAMDFANFIAEAIVCGGVRRSSQICLFSADDKETLEAKTDLWSGGVIKTTEEIANLTITLLQAGYKVRLDSPHWTSSEAYLDDLLAAVPDFSLWSTDPVDREAQLIIDEADPKYRYRASRVMSNNSVHLWDKPAHEEMLDIIHHIQQTGEPGLYNAQVASRRRPRYAGTNPCGEILLDSQGVCNLTDQNLYSFVLGPNDFDYRGYEKALRLSTRMGSRMTNVTMWHPEWDATQKRDRLLGVSITGLVEAFDALGWAYEVDAEGNYSYSDDPRVTEIEAISRKIAREEADMYHEAMGIPRSLLVTTIKPSGSLSQLSTVSSGAHRPYAPYYLRRIRVSKVDPVAKALKDMGIPVSPENGQGDDLYSDKCNTWVFSFPVRTNAPVRAIDEKAIDQLERYKSLMTHYVEHNVSYTVTVAPHEWDEVAEWLLENWDSYVGISFLPRFDPTEGTSPYPQLPYETLTKEKYEELAAKMPLINEKDFNALISKYEKEYEEFDLGADCSTGFCPIR